MLAKGRHYRRCATMAQRDARRVLFDLGKTFAEYSPMLRAIAIAVFTLAGATGAAAHGVSATDRPAPESRGAIDLFRALLPSAHAAVQTRVEPGEGVRYLISDGLPDHATGVFPNPGNPHRISAQRYEFRVPLQPRAAGQITPLTRAGLFGVAVNGVPFDPFTAEFWNNDRRWNYEALGGAMGLGLDQSNAHVQPNGAYHYHGIPRGILERFAQSAQPILIGYAADGFPIYGPHGYRTAGEPAAPLAVLRPSYRVKQGMRPGGPGGRHDGTFVEDYEFVAGLGDLDACNGRTGVTPEFPSGTYYYVVTDGYPFVPRCFVGTPDPSFQTKGGPGGPRDRGPPGHDPLRRGPPPGGHPPFGPPPRH